ncbi:hypothetical protein FJ546_06060 [Mesorhizobium sp. B2-4-19]|uniref:hypothetical protein n=1 Tax=Mesorhizobium sp. B2-4-19 TaxID=2589930 RepID=UPI00112C17A0|nr:hypothetical protein [Mesorhizobium sp. B2-4-19]TPK66336.1 hypothetical protein FJ546_06060 [Mesorhizobium sp. B2-4-19]
MDKVSEYYIWDTPIKVPGNVAFPDGCEPEIQAWLRANEGEHVGHLQTSAARFCDEDWYINEDDLPAGAKQDRLGKTDLPAAPEIRRWGRIVSRTG